MAIDKYSGFSASYKGPATSLIEVTPDDGADISHSSIALAVETPGFVQVTTMAGDVARVWIAAGTAFPLRVNRVWQTGTTATGIRALV